MTNLSGISLICVAGDGAGFTSSVCAPANVAVIPSTAKPATPAITLHTDLFMLPPLPIDESQSTDPEAAAPGVAAGLHACGLRRRSKTQARTAAPQFRRLRCRPWHHQR